MNWTQSLLVVLQLSGDLSLVARPLFGVLPPVVVGLPAEALLVISPVLLVVMGRCWWSLLRG